MQWLSWNCEDTLTQTQHNKLKDLKTLLPRVKPGGRGVDPRFPGFDGIERKKNLKKKDKKDTLSCWALHLSYYDWRTTHSCRRTSLLLFLICKYVPSLPCRMSFFNHWMSPQRILLLLQLILLYSFPFFLHFGFIFMKYIEVALVALWVNVVISTISSFYLFNFFVLFFLFSSFFLPPSTWLYRNLFMLHTHQLTKAKKKRKPKWSFSL